MYKSANKAKLLSVLGALGLPVGMDVMQHDDFSLESFDKKRIGNAILNAAIGAGAGHMSGKGKLLEGVSMASLAPAKDLLLNLQDTPNKVNAAMETLAEGTSNTNKLIAGLGIGALGLGAAGLIKYLTKKDPKTDMGSIKLKLPGKKGEPNTDAEVVLPIDMPQLSPSLMDGLNRGVRVQTRKNVRANSMKRDPETGKLIPIDEWEEKYKGTMYDPEMNKAASREWAEGAGQALTGVLGASLGSAIGNKLVDDPKYAPLGSIGGAIIGGLGPAVLGRIIANIIGDRKDTDQYKHDQHAPLAEYLIPGYAAYQNERRLNQVEDPDKYKNKLSFANTMASDAAFDSDDWEMDKYAGMAPPPPGPQGPPPPPKPKNTQRPAGDTVPPAQEARFISTGSGTPAGKGRRAAMAVRNFINSQKGKQEKAASDYTIECYESASSMSKQASVVDMSAREEARGIMKKIYDEDPSYWPYGLDIPGHESLYLIRDNMTKAAAGFVGWQEMIENGKKVGSYSIGILPEYRNKGFAKEAVAKVLRIKSASVDEVRAYVMKHNAPSHALADSLGVKVTESF
jgi:RimJ/RimL family protein N-acetyltransferase